MGTCEGFRERFDFFHVCGSLECSVIIPALNETHSNIKSCIAVKRNSNILPRHSRDARAIKLRPVMKSVAQLIIHTTVVTGIVVINTDEPVRHYRIAKRHFRRFIAAEAQINAANEGSLVVDAHKFLMV